MSYSRWSNSRWYTFWKTQSEPTNHNNAQFCVCEPEEETIFLAAEIRKNVDACIARLKDSRPGHDASQDELQELRGYMLEFLADIDARYPHRST